MAVYVGIDVHKKRCQACLKDEDGHMIEELSFQSNHEGITQLKTPARQLPRSQNFGRPAKQTLKFHSP